MISQESSARVVAQRQVVVHIQVEAAQERQQLDYKEAVGNSQDLQEGV